jgi:hypothetical protein
VYDFPSSLRSHIQQCHPALYRHLYTPLSALATAGTDLPPREPPATGDVPRALAADAQPKLLSAGRAVAASLVDGGPGCTPCVASTPRPRAGTKRPSRSTNQTPGLVCCCGFNAASKRGLSIHERYCRRLRDAGLAPDRASRPPSGAQSPDLDWVVSGSSSPALDAAALAVQLTELPLDEPAADDAISSDEEPSLVLESASDEMSSDPSDDSD